jgi:UTP:GlnB (protein PII) uridylyltransferase
LSALPERYLYANDPREIVDHALFAKLAQEKPASIRVLTKSDPYVELCVVADDRPGLLAMITATFSHAKLKVFSAQIYSWTGQDGRTRSLDVFWVRSGQEAEYAVKLVPGLERDLEALIAGKADPVEVATGARAQAKRPSDPSGGHEGQRRQSVGEQPHRDRSHHARSPRSVVLALEHDSTRRIVDLVRQDQHGR